MRKPPTTNVRRFPRKKGAPKLKPICGQCGREMTGLFPRETDHLDHELQTGVVLNLRVFATSTNPEHNGFVSLRISEDGFLVGWMGERRYGDKWHYLIQYLMRCDGITLSPPDKKAP